MPFSDNEIPRLSTTMNFFQQLKSLILFATTWQFSFRAILSNTWLSNTRLSKTRLSYTPLRNTQLINKLTALFAATVLVSSVSASASPNADSQISDSSNGRTILVVGDSLSAAYGINVEDGWVSLLQKKLDQEQQGFRVINASISGETASGGERRIGALLQQWQPDLVILELGGNDGLRGVSTKTVTANLASMIEQSQQASADVLLLGMHIPPNYGPRYTSAFHQVYHTLAEKYAINLVPFFLENVATRRDWMQADGIHPTAGAQQTMLDNVWPALEAML